MISMGRLEITGFYRHEAIPCTFFLNSGQFTKRIMIRFPPFHLSFVLSYFFPSLISLPSQSLIPLSWEVPQDFPCNTAWVLDNSAMNVSSYCCNTGWFWIFKIWPVHSLSVLQVQVIPALSCSLLGMPFCSGVWGLMNFCVRLLCLSTILNSMAMNDDPLSPV